LVRLVQSYQLLVSIMEIDREITSILVAQFPSYNKFVHNGKVIVKLDRALYGCIESALLWYEAISSFLMSVGFQKCDQDECLFILILVKTPVGVSDGRLTSKPLPC
jgi:hypothetical protein